MSCNIYNIAELLDDVGFKYKNIIDYPSKFNNNFKFKF